MRINRIASPHTHAIAATMGSALSAAAHQAKAGNPSGLKRANASGTNIAGRQPRTTYSTRSRASDATSCNTTRLTAGQIQSNGATLAIAPATRNAAGITCPS